MGIKARQLNKNEEGGLEEHLQSIRDFEKHVSYKAKENMTCFPHVSAVDIKYFLLSHATDLKGQTNQVHYFLISEKYQMSEFPVILFFLNIEKYSFNFS